MHRHTLKRPASLRGIGLFTGAHADATILPARSGGLRFVRGGETIAAVVANVPVDPSRTPFPSGVAARNTTLAGERAIAATIEHVMSALAGLGITDAAIELRGPELPMLDGSAEPIIDAISAAGGLLQLDEPLTPIVPRETLVVEGPGGSFIRVEPRSTPGSSFSYTLDYSGKAGLGRQSAAWDGRAATYQVEVAPARTFCPPREMLVLDDESGSPVENELRFENEPARHKLLDLIGDLALVGAPIQADIVAQRSGHALAHEACRRILAALS
jgi:UDP-3-O-acyl-N-acetylglucosamine deacetylase